ncbi:VWA domain-containing protein [Actinacidiphila yeochonensis]|uniref:VWA domain-containing protein n=1 Tax=Actinacidiphila yeochonensis TaxID=89050 RepID=UPI00056B6005|nr:VWA domain-containing protein [Actinacidiphila yeochonensis]
MEALTLGKGENAVLEARAVVLRVAAGETPVDVSALLLGANGKVRSDDDLVFYNHATQSGVSLAGDTVTADLPRIPAEVRTVVIVASVDATRPGAVFTTAPVLTAGQGDGAGLAFTPPDFEAGETVVVLAEIYRRDGGWKVRAVGQGYASGLAGLATDYGVDVEPALSGPPARPPAPRTSPAAVSAERPSVAKVEAQAPGLLEATRQAGHALARTEAAGRRAAVYVVLDHDWSMRELYESFTVQAFIERVLALSVNLDDDGIVPVVFSSGNDPVMDEVRLDNYRGRIGELHAGVPWGWGNVSAAMKSVLNHYQESGAVDPAFVVTQVGGEPWDKSEFRSLLQTTASLDVFWLFVGFGYGRLAFFKNLNASTSPRLTNVAFYEAGRNPGAVPDETFYAGLLDGFGAWMSR